MAGEPKLRRRDVAKRLGISTSSVRRLEDEQVLRPTLDESGAWLFDPQELKGLRDRLPIRPRGPRAAQPGEREAARSGRIAAKVFLLFARRLSLAQIVVLTKQPPERIRDLYHQWVTTLEEGEWVKR